MSKSRLDLHEELCSILGSRNVYFQPPESVRLQYPCIIYHRAAGDNKFADDRLYLHTKEYSVLVIDKDPDTIIPDEIMSKFQMCRMASDPYNVDNLHHYPLNLYY